MSRLKKILAATAYTAMIAFALAAFAYNLVPECETEDSSNCVWYADTQGNGEGHSFIDIGGMVVPIP